MEIQDLSCGYQGAVVRNVTLNVDAGELWCVLGPNGVGKTTLFKTFLGLLKPLGGRVLFDGKDLHRWRHKELAKRIAYVPQSHEPPFPFLVEEVVAMGRNPHQSLIGRMRAEDRAAVDGALSLLGIGHLRGARYTRISGGERQLTLLARAIAQETAMLVLDEPTANLDFGNQARVLTSICALARDLKKTLVMTTHVPDHGFLPDCKVIMLSKDGPHRAGPGQEVVTEEAIRNLYHIENRIIHVKEYGKRTCIPLYP
jgi:iron complex transport system ATP-binding protein